MLGVLARFHFDVKNLEGIRAKHKGKGDRESIACLNRAITEILSDMVGFEQRSECMREQAWQISGGRAFLAEGTASAKAWRQKCLACLRNDKEVNGSGEECMRVGSKS